MACSWLLTPSEVYLIPHCPTPFLQTPLSDPAMEMTKTPAERAREKSLLNDPLAIVLGPSCVECRQCKKKIKLSSKSAYDTFHWRNHRARCLRTLKKAKKKKEIPPRQPVSTPLKAATTSKPPPHNVKPRKSQTPPLIDISDSEEDQSSASAKSSDDKSPDAPSSPQSIQTPTDLRHLETSSILDDYIFRSHPECTKQTRLLSDHWQSWSWSQLKEPRFEPPDYNGDDDDEEQDDEFVYNHRKLRYSPYPRRIDADTRDHEAAHALSMLSRSH